MDTQITDPVYIKHDLIISYHNYEIYRCKKWVINTRRVDLLPKTPEAIRRSGCMLCASHFEANQFMNPSTKNKLMPSSVPTIFDVPNPPSKLESRRKIPERHALKRTVADRGTLFLF